MRKLVKKPTPAAKKSADLSDTQVRAAIPRIEARLDELRQLDFNAVALADDGNDLDRLSQKANATLRSIFGAESIEYAENEVSLRPQYSFYVPDGDYSIHGNMDVVQSNVKSAITSFATLVEILREQIDGVGDDLNDRVIRSYEGLDLHPEIARAASRLYKDGHYSSAVEHSVKALNGLVRMRSGLEYDGTQLMERAFNPTAPVIKFNDLADQSDKDEQKGFMMMFSGAVSGLRNPRAHSFIEDDPERALEFIAFVSLLAKLVDEASA
ncbi:TIGR02391 family protein [Paracoccus marcusii]|uniref:TIGR02391 family protein n=1 Tax=Paracoccus marcusii TaxID=59779 RepID=UPI0038B91621